ncbi:hypothetical protein [Acetobacter senegalensis]|uniref:hypothetical protein n=1 Tax=Acetobacter senegalensis TaxID=446692 RepID=UPI001EDED929|nr:hypothetical protein [Acetobacter senegalensis]MCG4273939.1 hypothetical protein [Acetobacter senegalensis]
MKYADIRIVMTVAFDDDGILDLKTQALEALQLQTNLPFDDIDAEVIGEVRDTEFLP